MFARFGAIGGFILFGALFFTFVSRVSKRRSCKQEIGNFACNLFVYTCWVEQLVSWFHFGGFHIDAVCDFCDSAIESTINERLRNHSKLSAITSFTVGLL